jgi:hypothetical protein
LTTERNKAVRALVDRGIAVSEPFHDASGLFHHAGREGILGGLQPQRRSCGSYAAFSDPDGNGWVMQGELLQL